MVKFITKKTCIVLAIIILYSGLNGCSKDWLDAKADITAVVPENLLEFQGLLDNVGLMHQINPISAEIASDNQTVSDVVFNTQLKSYATDAYKWSKLERHAQVTADWNIPYSKVLIDNIILDGLKKIQPNDVNSEAEWKNVKGQALFHRASIFLSLVGLYAPQYNSSTADKDLAIPLRLSSDINIPTTRATVREAYDQIITDLIEATNLLSSKQKFPTRPSKAAAYGLLSRVYLIMGEYEKSMNEATECLKLNNSLLDFNSIPGNKLFIGRYNVEVLYHSNFAPNFIGFAALMDLNLYNSYEKNDLRKTRYYIVNADKTIGYKGNYESAKSNFFDGVATDEIYLIRSECYARLNRVADAMADLNTLMKKRWDNTVPYPEISASNAEDALVKILQERRKELVMRSLRWLDLRRLNKDHRFTVSLSREVNGTTYTLEPNSFKYTFPIPDDIIEQTGIAQNPGWQ